MAAAIAVCGLLVYFEYSSETGDPAALAGRQRGGLVGYWKFEGAGVADSSGKNNDGVYVNSGPVGALFGQALKLKGDNNSHVSIPATQSLAAFSDEITVTAWVLPRVVPTDYRVVVSRQIGTLKHPDQFYLGFGPANGEIHYKWHLGTIEDGQVHDRAIYTGDPVAGRWINMAGVYDGKTMRLYINGIEIGRQKQTGRIQVDDNPVTIGAEENGAEPLVVEGEFDGLIDEVRIYNRALSPAEVKAIFEQRPT
ncbi:MAG: LamG domain-containing protein [Bauldia sp.]